MGERDLLDLDALARRLLVEPDWLKTHLGRLYYKQGFPRPLPFPGRLRRWDPLAIDRWLDRWLAPDAATASANAPPARRPPTAADGPEDDALTIELRNRARAQAARMTGRGGCRR